jgi:hypothetical protein
VTVLYPSNKHQIVRKNMHKKKNPSNKQNGGESNKVNEKSQTVRLN